MVPTQKSSEKFHCEKCDYSTSRQSQYDRHLQTDKHKILQNPTSKSSASKWICICGKNYKHSSTLYAHKKYCDNIQKEDTSKSYGISEQTFNQQVIEALIKITQNGTINHSNNTNTNIKSHNKTFNLSFFLNETCKDAMNISEFVNSVKVDLDDLEHTGRQGYVQGITSIVVKNLNKLSYI